MVCFPFLHNLYLTSTILSLTYADNVESENLKNVALNLKKTLSLNVVHVLQNHPISVFLSGDRIARNCTELLLCRVREFSS